MNNTVMLWLVLPVLLGLGLVLLQRVSKLSNILGSLFPLFFALLAVLFSNGLTLNLLGRIFVLDDSLLVFGRTIQVSTDQLGIIAFFYFLCFAWNLLSRRTKTCPRLSCSRSSFHVRPSKDQSPLRAPWMRRTANHGLSPSTTNSSLNQFR